MTDMLYQPLDFIAIQRLAGLVSGSLLPEQVPEDVWPELVSLALDHGLGAMLLWSLRYTGWPQLDQDPFQPLVQAARQGGLHSLLLESSRRQAAKAFDLAGIPAIWLKGIGLAHTCYPQPQQRSMSDLDVLVSLQQMQPARETLLSIGFKPAEIDFFELAGFTDEGRHHESLLDRTGQVKLELHFYLLDPGVMEQLTPAQHDWFWTQTEQLAATGPSFQALKPEANLLHLCAHAVLQNQGAPIDLLHLFDLHLLITRRPLDWQLLVQQAVALRWTFALEHALSLLPDLFATPLPEGVLHSLQQRRPADERLPTGFNHTGSTRRWEEWRKAFGRMHNRQRLQLVFSTLFPPRKFMRRQYRLPPDRLLLPYYLIHFLDGAREILRAVGTHSSIITRDKS